MPGLDAACFLASESSASDSGQGCETRRYMLPVISGKDPHNPAQNLVIVRVAYNDQSKCKGRKAEPRHTFAFEVGIRHKPKALFDGTFCAGQAAFWRSACPSRSWRWPAEFCTSTESAGQQRGLEAGNNLESEEEVFAVLIRLPNRVKPSLPSSWWTAR